MTIMTTKDDKAPAAPQQKPPMDAWIGYAKQSGLLNEDGVATDPHKTQTAWFAFTAAWNLAAAHPQAAQPQTEQEATADTDAHDLRQLLAAQPQEAGQTRELPPLPKHLVAIDLDDDESWGELQEHAWDSDYASDLKLNAPLFTAGQMQAYARAAIAQAAPSVPDGWKQALHPFSEIADLYDDHAPGAIEVGVPVTLEQCRAARAVLVAAAPLAPSVSADAKDAEQWRTTFYLQRKSCLPEWENETPGHKRLEDSLACVQDCKSTADRPLRIIEIKQRTVMDQAAIDAALTAQSKDQP